MGRKPKTDTSPKKTYKWPTGRGEDAQHHWPTGRGKDAQHHWLLEKCKLKQQGGITSHQSESLQTRHAGEGMEKGQPPPLLVGK